MEMSKCLCVLIIAVIVIAANASPVRERRNGGSSGCKDNGQGSNGNSNGQNSNGWNGQPYTISKGNYYFTNQQTNITNIQNKCNNGETYCCNNVASSNSNTNGRRKRTSGSSIGNLFGSSSNSNQVACDQAAEGGSNGDQYTGCDASQSCCQGNSGSALVDLQCSSVSTSSSPSS
ncbi:unnamed protein product [Adineta steineri]|uniref:Hydrophobin n=1 Tax=Adineta steineri TaxID=433720 RepID=A0A815KGQ8_9BILA|nr:unnamed protein product [Adineta steineri]